MKPADIVLDGIYCNGSGSYRKVIALGPEFTIRPEQRETDNLRYKVLRTRSRKKPRLPDEKNSTRKEFAYWAKFRVNEEDLETEINCFIGHFPATIITWLNQCGVYNWNDLAAKIVPDPSRYPGIINFLKNRQGATLFSPTNLGEQEEDFHNEFSPSLAGAIYQAGFTSWDQLAAKTERELVTIPGLGPCRVSIIRKTLKQRGLCLANDRDTKETRFYHLPERIRNTLARVGVTTFDQLAQLPSEVLIKARSCGKQTFSSIVNVMVKEGIQFTDGMDQATVYLTGQPIHKVPSQAIYTQEINRLIEAGLPVKTGDSFVDICSAIILGLEANRDRPI